MQIAQISFDHLTASFNLWDFSLDFSPLLIAAWFKPLQADFWQSPFSRNMIKVTQRN